MLQTRPYLFLQTNSSQRTSSTLWILQPRIHITLLVRSKRRWDLSTFEIVEEDLGPFPKVVTHVKTFQNTQVFHLSGNGADEEPVGVFSIGLKNGSLTQHKRIDREKNSHFYMMFDILNDDRSKGDLTLKFNVAVKDINDNPPIFEHPVMTESITENSPEGYLPVQLIAIDRDQENTDNSNFKISLLSQDPAEPKISVKHVEGTKMSQLTLTGCFNYDVRMHCNTLKLIFFYDRGEPALSSEAVVYLDVVDSNTHPPVFKENIVSPRLEIVRVAVTDADTPNTPGWRAVYSIVKGNEDGNYKIVTDPKTNEGVLSVIKVSPTTLTNVQIAVENEEPLFVCPSGQDTSLPRTQTVNVTVKVIDVNDPPEFKENITKVYVKEEDQPGKVLYKPTVIDVDSDVKNIRYELVDPAGWVTIDPKTGAVTTVKPMDRESSYVNKDNIYTILVRAIDDGEPPATATGTVLIHLGDINDNIPHVVKKELVMCGNKVNVTVEDKDQSPYGCPCSFSLGADKNKNSLKSLWKLNPANGMEVGLVSLKSLPYGNYTVPLVVQDQQGQVGNSTVHVLVCDCGETCENRSIDSHFELGFYGNIFASDSVSLSPVLLLFCLQCECGRAFSKIPVYLQDEGNQTLIKYNEEGGGSACKVCGPPCMRLYDTVVGSRVCATGCVCHWVCVSVCNNTISILAHRQKVLVLGCHALKPFQFKKVP
uniref:Cadherin domain-containing protein n=1 Tax=Esox lucius TaxID=8010 RepID=A0A6Q2XVQ3_ESOLU